MSTGRLRTTAGPAIGAWHLVRRDALGIAQVSGFADHLDRHDARFGFDIQKAVLVDLHPNLRRSQRRLSRWDVGAAGDGGERQQAALVGEIGVGGRGGGRLVGGAR